MTGDHPAGPQAAIIGLAIRFRSVVVALACVVAAYGLYGLGRARYDVFPEFAPPQVSIQTEAAGLTSEQVETLVTRPIEVVVNGLPGVKRVQSTSIQGLSVITVFFDSGTDIYRDRQIVGEQLAVAAQQLPAGVQAPAMTPLTSSTGLVLVAGLTSATHSLMELRTIADWTIRLRLLAVPGVANVAVFGGDVRSLQIQVHPDQLIRYGIGLNDVLTVARAATGIRGAGFMDSPNQRIVLQAEGQSLTPAALARTAVLQQGAGVVTLGDVADVVEAPAPAVGAGAIQGEPGVVLNVEEQYGTDTVAVTDAVEAALGDMRRQFLGQGVTLHTGLFRPASFIGTALGNIGGSLLLGGALVVIVLFLFLFDLRVAAISCTAIPLSLLAGAIALEQLGLTLNTMTLGGLAIAIGEVVDDAVIGVENIVRRLRENRRLASPRPEARVVLDASREVRSAVVYATFAVILVFLPVIALPGVAGRLFAPLGLAYVLAVLASLAVALTVTPALAMALLAGRRAQSADPPVVRWTRGGYERLLRGIARRPGAVMLAAAAFTVVGCAALPFFGGGFIPELKEGHFVVHMSAVPGTSLDQSLRLGARVAGALRQLPAVRSVAQRVGRAALVADTWGTHYSEFEVDLKPLAGEAAERAQAEVRESLAGFVGVNFSVKTFLTERIEETLSGYTASVAVNVIGNDLDVLDRTALEIAQALGQVPGATEVLVQSPPGMPQLTIHLRKPDLERWGLDAVNVLDLVHAAYQGEVVGQTYQDGAVFNVVALLDPASRNRVTDVGGLPLRTTQGRYVLLKQVADIYEATGRYQVTHLGAQRMQTVTANVAGRAVTAFVRDAKAAVAAKVPLPVGTYLQFTGAAEGQSRARDDLIVNSLIAGAGIVLLLSVVTRGWRNLALVLVNLPFALVGGVLAVFATGGMVSLGSMVGFVTLSGITLRNSIMMVSHYEYLVETEGLRWGPDTAVAGAADRLVPILMTSLVTALGLLPLAAGMGDPGREVEGPMAVVILGGLITSMALNLLVLPTLALRFGRFELAQDEFSAAPVASLAPGDD